VFILGFTDQGEINSMMNMKRLLFFLHLDFCPQYFHVGLLIVIYRKETGIDGKCTCSGKFESGLGLFLSHIHRYFNKKLQKPK